jgi:hypothetical protein
MSVVLQLDSVSISAEDVQPTKLAASLVTTALQPIPSYCPLTILTILSAASAIGLIQQFYQDINAQAYDATVDS